MSTVLAGILLLASILALMPVEQVISVHSTIQGTVIKATNTLTDSDWDSAATGPATQDEKRITCTDSALIREIIFDIGGTLTGGDNINLVIDPDGTSTAFAAVTKGDIFAGNSPASEPALLSATGLSQGVALLAGGTASLTFATEAADAGNEAVSISAIYVSQGTCTITEQ